MHLKMVGIIYILFIKLCFLGVYLIATNIKLLLFKKHQLRRICMLIHSNRPFHNSGAVSNIVCYIYQVVRDWPFDVI